MQLKYLIFAATGCVLSTVISPCGAQSTPSVPTIISGPGTTLSGIRTAPPTLTTTSAVDANITISWGANQSVTAISRGGVSDRIGLQPDQLVDVTVQFSTSAAGRTIIVEPLDGGRIIGTSNRLLIASDGTFSFRFQIGHNPGIYQVSLHDRAKELGLQFWVLDSQNPENNPPVINSGN
jgi:hypothetical protein